MSASIGRTLTLSRVPVSIDAGLLILRVWIGFSLFLKHGLEKLTRYSQMAAYFPDPIHIGSHAGLIFALVCDAICSILIILGFATRLAALLIVINLAVAFALVHRFGMFGPHNGELAFLYFGAALVLVITGGGRFSIDHLLR
ncbi:MAG TPA: DoxX family protein [Candidatus Binataceae bacterium]|nr:DoxX family protein [Candidatus Binataceae bacterium]